MSTLEQVQAQTLTTGGLRAARVNLLPPEIEDARRLKRTQAGLALGLVAVVVALGGVYALQARSAVASASRPTVFSLMTTSLSGHLTK